MRGLTVTLCPFAASKPRCLREPCPGHVCTGVHRQEIHREESRQLSSQCNVSIVSYFPESVPYHFYVPTPHLEPAVSRSAATLSRYLNCTRVNTREPRPALAESGFRGTGAYRFVSALLLFPSLLFFAQSRAVARLQ